MNIPEDLFFTKEHEWVRIEGKNATIGISDFAQNALGDVTFVELPKPGAEVAQFQILASVESVKAASDVYAPLSGTIAEVNAKLETAPGLINQSCFRDGWIAKITVKNPDEKKNLMDASGYKKFLEGLKH